MTITDEELRRFDALLCNGPLSRERGRDLVAELRQLTVQRSAYRAEADALRAENERLRKQLEWPERCALLAGEAAELRASLADAVGKIAAMEPLLQRCVQVIQAVAPDHEVLDAVDEYEASLPGLVKVEP